MPPEPQITPSNQMPISSLPPVQVPQISYAGFWLRFLAFALDCFVVTIAVTIPTWIIMFVFGDAGGTILMVVLYLLQMVLVYTYFVFFTNKNQATIGKKLLGLRVISEDGTRLSLGKIILRETIGKFISSIILGIGYLMIAGTSKKQGLHDKMVGSVVISNPAERKAWAYVTGIVFVVFYFLLIPIMIFGILSSIVLASLNVAREKGADTIVKSNLSIVRAQAEIDYNMNNSYGSILTDPIITDALKKAATTAGANPTGNVTATAYAIYFPLMKPTAPNTGWCVDSTGRARESVDPVTATVCP